jgi:G:T-mismatch repair DNA endonuclease (very short patch repair protein)
VEDGYDLTPEGRASLSVRRREANFKRKAEGRYGHTEETRKKLSASTAKAIAEGRIPRISKFEREVGVVLRSLGVKAQPQHGIRDAQGRFRAVLDFWLPELGVGVEANGTFWHADPRVFPQGPEHASQKRTAERYARKMALLNLRGVPVIEVWEKDFREDPKGAVQDALRGLNAPGD